MLLVTLYALASAVPIVLSAMHFQWLIAFGIFVLSSSAYKGGEELLAACHEARFTNKLGRCIVALLFIALALYVANFSLNFVVVHVPSSRWVILGIAMGALANHRLTGHA